MGQSPVYPALSQAGAVCLLSSIPGLAQVPGRKLRQQRMWQVGSRECLLGSPTLHRPWNKVLTRLPVHVGPASSSSLLLQTSHVLLAGGWVKGRSSFNHLYPGLTPGHSWVSLTTSHSRVGRCPVSCSHGSTVHGHHLFISSHFPGYCLSPLLDARRAGTEMCSPWFSYLLHRA